MDYIASLKNEIQNDPDRLGYAGKTPLQIANLINSPEVSVVPIPIAVTPTPATEMTIVKDAPIGRVINGIPNAPNIASEQDVINALK